MLVALVIAGTAIGCEESRSPELVLKVPVERTPRSVRSAHEDLSPGDSVELRLPGEWFDPARELSVIDRDAADLSSPITASEAAYSAFKSYEDDWIVASFAEWDRPEIRQMLADAGVNTGSRGYYEQVTGKRVDGWAGYATDSTDYRLVFVTLFRPAPTTRVETFVLESEEWRRTNQLVRDTVFQMAWNTYRHGTITQK